MSMPYLKIQILKRILNQRHLFHYFRKIRRRTKITVRSLTSLLVIVIFISNYLTPIINSYKEYLYVHPDNPRQNHAIQRGHISPYQNTH